MRCCPAPPTHLMPLQGSAPPTHLMPLQGQPVSAPPLTHSLEVNSTHHDNNINNNDTLNWIIAQSSSRGQRRGTRTQDHTPSLPWQSADPQTDISFTFEERVGSTLSMPEDSCPVDFFRAIVNDSFITLIVDETNR